MRRPSGSLELEVPAGATLARSVQRQAYPRVLEFENDADRLALRSLRSLPLDGRLRPGGRDAWCFATAELGDGGAMDLAWKAEGACRGVDPELFFPVSDVDAEPARRVCAACVVRDHCLDHALTTRENEGIWGGLTPAERRALGADRAVLSA